MKRDIAEEEAEPTRRTSTLTKRLAHTRDGEGDGSGRGRSKRSGGNGAPGGRAAGGSGGAAAALPAAAAAVPAAVHPAARRGRRPHRRRRRPPGVDPETLDEPLAGEGFEHAPDEAEDERHRPRARSPIARPSRAGATAVTGDAADGHARVGDDGPGAVALHDLAARPLLGRDRRRVPGRPDRRGAVRVPRQRLRHPRPPRHPPDDRAGGDPRRADRDRARSTSRACAASAPARAAASTSDRRDVAAGRASMRRLLAVVAVLAAPAAARGAAAARRASVSARVERRADTVAHLRAGDHAQRPRSSTAGAVTASGCSRRTACDVAVPPGKSPLHVLDLDGNGEPDVVLGLFSGGAHCCFIDQVFSFDPATKTYVRSAAQLPRRRRAADPARRPHGFLGPPTRGSPRRASPTPPTPARRSRSGVSPATRFTDVTRHYPTLIRPDAARWMRAVQPPPLNGVGLIAAWAADEDLLGQSSTGGHHAPVARGAATSSARRWACRTTRRRSS